MTNANRARYLHRLLDLLVDKQDIGVRNIEKLRAELPEIPKQKTLEELRREVYDVWVDTNDNEWPDDIHGEMETWLYEFYLQLKGLEPAAPAHPEFLETEADYEDAPLGTIVTIYGVGCAWVKDQHGWIGTRQIATSSSRTMADGRCRVLRWGWGE